MKINKNEFYNKVLGCWMGKNIGGTLGAPIEWRRECHNFDFYIHDINGEPLPNDDLDLQLIWLFALQRYGAKVDAKILGEFWLNFQVAHYSEYGIAKANMRNGYMPPISGTLNNPFKDSCGSFIRSEIWACVCAGNPDLAVKYCYEDSIVDHGNGEGTYAAMFTGAMEAAAFVESDFRKLINIGLSYIPEDCGTAKAIKTAIECYDKKIKWQDARDVILENHRGCCFFNNLNAISQADIDKGFHTGQLGYDVPSNIAIIVAGMLYGEGDFDKTMCITVNMGEDTDCTAGTVGSIFGIIYGFDKIPQRWIEPIGHGIKTVCLNLGDMCQMTPVPQTVEELTDQTIEVAKRFSLEYGLIDIFTDEPTEIKPVEFKNNITPIDVLLPMNGPRYEHDIFVCSLEYEKHTIKVGEPVKVKLLFYNKISNIPMNLTVSFIVDDSFSVSPADETTVLLAQTFIYPKAEVEFEITVDEARRKYEAVVEISVEGRFSKLYVPIIFAPEN